MRGAGAHAAEVVRRFTAPNGVTRRLEYRVTGVGGRTGTRNAEVKSAYWNRLENAKTVPVVYVPDEPAVSRLVEGEVESRDLADSPGFMMGLSVALIGLCVVFLAAAAMQWFGWDIDLDSKTGKFVKEFFGPTSYGALGSDAEPAADVLQDLRRGRRRERQDPLGAVLAGEPGQFQIVGPEIVPPLGNAVRLVHREDRNRHALDRFPETLVVEPFGRHVQQPQLALAHGLHHARRLLGIERRVQPLGRDAQLVEPVQLVLHQGDQRRDHDRQTRQEQGRQLVA